jgi:hypothetical protein
MDAYLIFMGSKFDLLLHHQTKNQQKNVDSVH